MSAILLLLYTKEVFFGYKSNAKVISYKTIIFFVLLEIVIVIYLYKPVLYLHNRLEGRDAALLFATATILVSFAGLIWNRLHLPTIGG